MLNLSYRETHTHSHTRTHTHTCNDDLTRSVSVQHAGISLEHTKVDKQKMPYNERNKPNQEVKCLFIFLDCCAAYTHRGTHTRTQAHMKKPLHIHWASSSLAAWRLSIISYLQVAMNDVLFMPVCVCICEYLYLYSNRNWIVIWGLSLFTRAFCLLPSATRIARLWFINNSKWKVIGGTCGMWNVFMRQMKNSLFNYVCIFAGNQQLITEPETLQPSYAPNLKGATGVEDIRPVSWSSSSKSIDVIDSCTRTDHNCSNLHHWLEMRCW